MKSVEPFWVTVVTSAPLAGLDASSELHSNALSAMCPIGVHVLKSASGMPARLDGVSMVVGHSAGVAAALAAADDVAPQALDYPRLSARLRAQGQVLDLPR